MIFVMLQNINWGERVSSVREALALLTTPAGLQQNVIVEIM